MFNFNLEKLNQISKDTNFNKNNIEKVLRLYCILDSINNSSIKNLIVLKGGTAINLFLLNVPRLSIDLDFDFNINLNKEDMKKFRFEIDSFIRKMMNGLGYSISEKSRFAHTLDSYVFSYITYSNSSDTLKIDINYSNRVHVLKPFVNKTTNRLGITSTVLLLASDELIGSKINALITRTTPRDIYDVYALFKNGYILNSSFIKKIAIFYICLGSEIPIDIDKLLSNAKNRIKSIQFKKIKMTLLPLLKNDIFFETNIICDEVVEIIDKMFILDDNDLEFIECFNNNQFKPNILFKDCAIEDLSNHPMGLWKTKH